MKVVTGRVEFGQNDYRGILHVLGMHPFHEGHLDGYESGAMYYVVMLRQTSLGVMVLNSPGAVSLPVTAPSGFFSLCVEKRVLGFAYL